MAKDNTAYKERLSKGEREARWKLRLAKLRDVAAGVEGSQGTVTLSPEDMETFMELADQNGVTPRSVLSDGAETFDPDREANLEGSVYCEDLCAALGLTAPPTHPKPPLRPVVSLVAHEPSPEEKAAEKEEAARRRKSAQIAARNRAKAEKIDPDSVANDTDPPNEN